MSDGSVPNIALALEAGVDDLSKQGKSKEAADEAAKNGCKNEKQKKVSNHDARSIEKRAALAWGDPLHGEAATSPNNTL
jgi:hypothetical protein